jgi:hypothetical protein
LDGWEEEIGLNRLLGVYAYEDEQFLRITRVKIKTVLLKSNNFFKDFKDNQELTTFHSAVSARKRPTDL